MSERIPLSYTFDQQRQEINEIATELGDIGDLSSGVSSVVAAINQLQAGSADGGELLSGPTAPTAGDGANGDFWLDTSTNNLYGPKENAAWPATTISFSEQILSGVVAPLSTLGKENDYYFDSVKKELYGPKSASGGQPWGLPTSLGEADYQNVLFVKPNGSDSNTGASPSKAFQSIKAAARAAAATDGNTTIRVATGKYVEDNPIYLPNGTSIVGDNLRETIVIPQNEGRDLFWITSGCYVNYMVFEDNFSGGLGYLETETSDNRTLSTTDQTFRVLPGHTLSRNDVVFGDAANQVEFKKTDLIASAIADMLDEDLTLASNPDYDEEICERDLGLVADAIIADLRSGGNVKSIQAGLSYRTPSATNLFTPTDATYDAATGVAVLTIPNHGMTTGNFIKFAPESMVFTCATDNHATQHSYPRVGDGNYNEWMEITNSSTSTITVNAGVSSDTSEHLFVSANSNSVISDTVVYGGELIPEIDGEEINQMYAIERLSFHAQAEILNNPSSDPGWSAAGYAPITQDTAGYPACARAQAYISTLQNIVTSIIRGDDVPQYNVGPGFILIDQEWMEVLDFDVATNTFIVNRGVNDPITGDATVVDKHITGAFVSQSGFTWRYAIAYPEQSGYQGKGRVNLQANNNIVSGSVDTIFESEFQTGWSIRINGNDYEIATIDNDGQLTLVDPVTVDATLDIYYIIPPKERIFLSPYTQNCSCISKLGRAVYDTNTKEYDASKTRAGGLFADGAQLDSNSPLESMVVDAFTQVVFGSIGFHIKNDAYAQLVSVFQVFESVGILAESGGYVSITNSATNFGDEGLKALGFSSNVLPIFSGGQLSSIQNITKTDINTSPSDIISTTFSSEAGGTATRVTIEVSIVDIGKFERGQTVEILDHSGATPDINGTGKVIDTVDFQNNRISIILQDAYDAATVVDGGTTGKIEIATGAVFTKINVTGYQAPPIPNYILKIPGIGLDPTGNEQVVGEVLSYDAGNFTEFTTNFPLSDSQIAGIANNASAQLFAPSTVNSSSHTFEYVGTGINYTAFPQNGGITDTAKQSVEVSSGKTYVSATDQSGNFSVGPFFNVNLRSGKVTFNGSVALGVLDSLQLKGSPGVPIFEFSPDNDLGGAVGRSDTVLPTQKAVRDYINDSEVLGSFIGERIGTSPTPGLIVQLDGSGTISQAQIPQTSTFVVYTVETEAERLQAYIPVASKTIVSNTANTITLDSVTDLVDGLVVSGTNIPNNTTIVIGGIDVATKTITVNQVLPTSPDLTVGDSLSFLGSALKAGDIVIQKNEVDGDPLTLLQTWILTALPGTDTNNWELIALNQLDAAAIVSGIMSPSRLGTGVSNDDTYLNGLNKFTPVVKGILPPDNSAITIAGTRETLKKTGTPIDVSSITWSADVATVTTASAHLLTTDNYVEIEQVIPDTYNGLYKVTVTSTTEFTYARSGNPGSYLSNGLVTSGVLNESGFIELDVDSVSYTTGQSSGSSSRGVSSYLYERFTIDTQNVVDIRDKGISLGKIQNIGPKTLLGNAGTLSANPEQIEIGVAVAGVTTFKIDKSPTTGNYTVFDEGTSQQLGELPTLQLVPGKEYVFRIGTITGQPFNIVTSPGTVGANLYTDGVIDQGTETLDDIVRFTVPQDAPQYLYYQSSGNVNNYGQIKVIKIPDNLEIFDSTSSSQHVLDEFGIGALNTVEYTIQIKNTVDPYFHSTKLMVLHDGTDVYINEYGTVFNNRRLGDFSADISGGNLRLLYTPAPNNNDYLNRLIIQKNYIIS